MNQEIKKFNDLSFEQKLEKIYQIQLEVKGREIAYPSWLTRKKFTIADVSEFAAVSISKVKKDVYAKIIQPELCPVRKKYLFSFDQILQYRQFLENKYVR
jgi:hypothetical protein